MLEKKLSSLEEIREYEKTPLDDRLTFNNTYEMIKQGASRNPDAPAISFFMSGDKFDEAETTSYRELMKRINQTANMFHDLGIGPNDVVTSLLPIIPEAHFIIWGAEAAGIINPVNSLLEPETIVELCKVAKTKILVVPGEIPGTDTWEKVPYLIKNLPDLKAVIRVKGPADEENGIYSYEEIIDKYNGDSLDSGRVIDPHDIASIYLTGGTTGTPKLAPHTHYNEASMIFIDTCTMEFHESETILCGVPLYHILGSIIIGALTFHIGGHVVLMTPSGYRDMNVVFNLPKIIDQYKAVTFAGVPTILSVILDLPKEGVDITSLRYVVIGGAPLSEELCNRFESETNTRIIGGYGCTEATASASGDFFGGDRKIGSIGKRLLYTDMKIFILDDEGNYIRDAEINEIGSICLKGPNIFHGYLDEHHNKGIWPKGKEEGYYNTGDLGRLDEDEFFWITGRKKELIIRGGHNIDPGLIEAPMYNLEGIQVVAAVGKPDAHAGELPILYVQLTQDSNLTEEEILEYAKNNIGERAAVPKEIIIMDELPLVSIGKIFKPALSRDAVKRAYTEQLQSLGADIDSMDISVGEDKIHGMAATIKIKPAQGISKDSIEEKIKDMLVKFTIKYFIKFA
ncbi:MAG: acyl-CoA synthetase [Desulfobacterales bacterium]|jgi:fatty-acyl-CoA synthase|nr:acyl-CoA synthetase [Desulfobacteraceae bacterium]MBT4363895.1 acyl-CoA synthetase [Desulfobacteraceae bacterium]MBT7086729.1 acyl-CoA synthetase [Desulfobacterales bacterium]